MGAIRFNPELPVVGIPVYKIVTEGRLFGQTIINTFFYIQGGTPTTIPTPGSVATGFQLTCNAEWNAAVSQDFTGLYIHCSRLDDRSIPSSKQPWLAAGTQLGPADRAFVSARCVRYTSTGGQRGRGMVRITGLTEASYADNELEPAAKLLMETLVARFLTSFATANPTDGTMLPALATVTIGAAPLFPREVRAQPLSGWIVDDLVGSQITRKTRPGG